jgi:hypothetical protein
MKKNDILDQEGSIYLIPELCSAILAEYNRDDFSLRYIKDKISFLEKYVDGLKEV